ncbi:MAG: VVA0879 family protein [Candidatus Hodarchaeales archaeon]
MKVVYRSDLVKQATELFGKNPLDWKFRCSSCKRIQSGNSIIVQMEEKIPSKRYGILKVGHRLHPETACYSPTCNWVANGLFRSPTLMIHDPDLPYNEDVLLNCTRIFSLVRDNDG